MSRDSQNGDRVVVVVATFDPAQPHVRELSRDRYVADSIGEALNAHAPDPAPGARFEVEYVGRARSVGAESEITSRGPSGDSVSFPLTNTVEDEERASWADREPDDPPS